MKIFKTEKVIYFKAKSIPTKLGTKSDKKIIISKPEEDSMNEIFFQKKNICPQHFLRKKVFHFHLDKFNSLDDQRMKRQNKGRWTLKEHIQFLQALDKFGINWKQVSDIIPSRTPNQIRSHSQKFFKKMKRCKDSELGIDFTSRHINNLNDMIAHIKSLNRDYKIVTVFLYLSEKYNQSKNSKIPNNVNNININNTLYLFKIPKYRLFNFRIIF